MKYGSGTSTAGTSGGGQQQHYGDGVINVGAAAMFSAMDAGGAQQSSVSTDGTIDMTGPLKCPF
jgi:hypothetical protein